MCCKRKSSQLHIRQLELIGDGYLSYAIRCKMIERFPNTPMKILSEVVSQAVSNQSLTNFGEEYKIGNGNMVESLIGSYATEHKFDKLEKLVNLYFNYLLKNTNLERKMQSEFEPISCYNFSKLNIKNASKLARNFKFKGNPYIIESLTLNYV